MDSGIGVYAPDSQAYVVFADLFDPIIEDYHGGFGKDARHPPSDFGDAGEFGDLDPDGKYIVSTRIRLVARTTSTTKASMHPLSLSHNFLSRCGRSLSEFPFNPNMSEANYQDLEKKVQAALEEKLTDDLAGQYLPLTGMDAETQQQLIDDHYLFKEGDRFLQAAKACEHWPTGRGIFFNEEKTFLVWVGEEDHLRIISMQPGGNVGDVYGRLINAVQALSEAFEFAHDERLGFLTFCPTNLGTTIRASVHIKLPKLAAGGQEALQEVADKYQLQVGRDTGPEISLSLNSMDSAMNAWLWGLSAPVTTKLALVGQPYWDHALYT